MMYDDGIMDDGARLVQVLNRVELLVEAIYEVKDSIDALHERLARIEGVVNCMHDDASAE